MKILNYPRFVWLALLVLMPVWSVAQTEPVTAIYSSLAGTLTLPLVKRDGVYYANAVYSVPSGQIMQITTPGSVTSSWNASVPAHDTSAATLFLPRVNLGSEIFYNVLVSVPSYAAWSVSSVWQGVNSGSGFPVKSTLSNRWATDSAGILSYVLDNGQVWRIAQGGEEPCFPLSYANANAMTIADTSNVSIYPNSSSPTTSGVSNSDYLMVIEYPYQSIGTIGAGGLVLPQSMTVTNQLLDGTAGAVYVYVNGGTVPIGSYTSTAVLQPYSATAVESCTVYPDVVNGAVITPTTALASAPAAVTGNVGGSADVLISGGVPPYTIVLDNTSVAQIAAQTPATGTVGQQVSMQLSSVGTATMTVVDYAQTRLTVPITVTASTLVASEDTLTGTVGDTPTLYVYGGIPPYSVTSSNTKVATVTAVQSGNGMSITVKMLSAGTATILVTDPDTSATKVINVTVSASSEPVAVTFFTFPADTYEDGVFKAPAIEATSGFSGYIYIIGGTLPITIANPFPDNLHFTYVGQSAEGWATYRVDFLLVPATVSVSVVFSDAVGQRTGASFKINPSEALSKITVTPMSIDAHAFANQFTLYVNGGYPPYEVFSGMDTIEVSQLTDKAFRIKVKAPYLDYLTNISVVDSMGGITSVPVTVLSQPPGYDTYK